MDIGIIIPELRKYGGAEKLLIECLRRWQYNNDITVYAIGFNDALLREHGVTQIKKKKLTPYIEGEHSMVLNSVLLPKIWEKEIGRHEIYHNHLWPTHLLNLHPMVWYPHEPLRAVNDLRFEQPVTANSFETKRNVHTYPKAAYDEVDIKAYSAYQAVISAFDKTGHPDKILANSNYTAGYLSRVYGIENVDVVYPGINADNFFYQQPDENVILNVNQLWPHKRVNLVIEAMQYVENAQLYIVGRGPEEENLKTQVKKLGLSDRIFFMGAVSNEELAILYARALCVAFAPVREPFGIVAVEAMAAGKPLVAVNEGGFCEAVADGENAFLVDAVPGEFAEKINFLINHKDVATRMGLSGREAVKKFTWQNTADGIMQALQEVWHEYRCRNAINVNNNRILIGIDYFVWYGKGFGTAHWNDNLSYGAVRQKPVLGYYSSDSGEIIRKHLHMLEKCGVDYVAANVHVDEHGLDIYQFNVTERILDIIEADDLKIRLCVQLCPFTTSSAKLLSAGEQIVEKFIYRPGYQQYRSKPLMFIFWTGSLDGDYELIEQLGDLFEACTLIASSMRPYNTTDEGNKTFGLFDGWSLFSPLEIASNPDEREKIIEEIYQQYEAGKQAIKVFTCSPGYDDSVLSDSAREADRLRTIARNNGNTFREMFKLAKNCQPRPDMIKISTFNEFHENTHIEPTVEQGSLYMDILREYIGNLK